MRRIAYKFEGDSRDWYLYTEYYPPSKGSIIIRRMGELSGSVVRIEDLRPEFNVADLYWTYVDENEGKHQPFEYDNTPGTLAPHDVPHNPVNAPSHYLHYKISPVEIIEDWKLGFHLGNTVKYIGRHEHKGTALEDLKKAQWYLARKIKLMEEEIAKDK